MSVRERYHGLTGFQRDILVAAGEEDEPFGLAIMRNLESKYGEELNHGRLYPNLDVLVQMGFIEKTEIDGRTNEYSVSPTGFLALEVACDEIEDVMEERPERAVADGGDGDA